MIPHESRIGDKIFTRYFVHPIDGFVAMSRSVMDDINKFDKSKPRIYSPHPIFDNFGNIKPRQEALETLKLSADFKYMLFFGFVRDYKGLDLLIEAFGDPRFRETNIRLIVAGEYYTNKEKYQALIQKYDLEDDIFEFDKFIADDEVEHYFNACDLLVQPYKTATQSGVTQIGYHFNKPMIVTNVGGLSEMCPDGKVGFVVEPKPKSIADAILKFYNDTDLEKMNLSIQEEKKNYSWEILTKNVFDLLSQIKDNKKN